MESSSSSVERSVALVQRGIAAWNARDWAAALADIDPGVEWHTSGVVPGLDEVYYGHDGVMRFWRGFTEIWDDIQIDTEELLERDGSLIVLARFRARGRDGLEVDQPVAFRFTENEVGLLTRFDAYWDRSNAPLDGRTTSVDTG